MPDNGTRIGAAVRDATGGRVEVTDAASLQEAVDTAFAWADTTDGGVVLLSPAAPSFGQFADYRARSAAFAAAASRLGPLS
jgi:UDP-N-acetylmuramoylalanine--D-glutamate ligase